MPRKTLAPYLLIITVVLWSFAPQEAAARGECDVIHQDADVVICHIALGPEFCPNEHKHMIDQCAANSALYEKHRKVSDVKGGTCGTSTYILNCKKI